GSACAATSEDATAGGTTRTAIGQRSRFEGEERGDCSRRQKKGPKLRPPKSTFIRARTSGDRPQRHDIPQVFENPPDQ
ncbi:MAG: hypothetical protein WAW54_08955, partial [Parvibaculum sedimenti]|uniref:hypothetical protein n=1 Tax=Parvibaculum sedimenti TaxID=2608632 RepID=UPI003BB622D4